MLLGNLVRSPELCKDILHPEPYRVQPVGALQASSCPPHTLRPPEMLHWSRSIYDLPFSHGGRNPGQHVPDAVKQALQSVTSFAALYQDPSARHHVRPPDQPPHLNRQVGLLEQLLHEEKLHTVMEDDPGTHSVEGWVCHRTVPPEAGPGALKEITQNNVFFICGTSPVVEKVSLIPWSSTITTRWDSL